MSKPKRNLLREVAEELDAFDIMLTSLVEVLKEKGILTQEEWENKIKLKVEKAKGLAQYREIQFSDE